MRIWFTPNGYWCLRSLLEISRYIGTFGYVVNSQVNNSLLLHWLKKDKVYTLGKVDCFLIYNSLVFLSNYFFFVILRN